MSDVLDNAVDIGSQLLPLPNVPDGASVFAAVDEYSDRRFGSDGAGAEQITSDGTWVDIQSLYAAWYGFDAHVCRRGRTWWKRRRGGS